MEDADRLAGFLAASLQHGGFNCDGVKTKTKIGIVSNEYLNACDQCDSRIGFGGAGVYDDNNSCGNVAVWNPDNGDKYIKAMGYIFVQ